ncbi:hybrid sensor histidine kinase/response regulator [Hydrogenophaga sp.]|uniref:ATP-binding response regulator n=1 Tax=Hydrogenophaga sp. TaxID=1904254 RepID=UPI00286DD6E0|nr:hybrid sensor histidine kinase/response regulator [Hydrogenophaga sp.]
MTTALDPAIRADAEEAMLHLRVGTSTRVLVGVCGAGAVVMALAWSHTTWPALVVWYGVMLLSQAARIWSEVHAAQRSSGRPLKQRLNWAGWSALMSGLVQAASLAFFPSEDGFEQALHTLILLVMSTGAVVYTAGHPRTYYPYMAPILLSLTLAWWTVSDAASERPELALGFGALLVVYAINLLGYARDTWAMFVNAAAMRHHEAMQNQRLAAAVKAAEAASHAKTRFLAAASHDLRQPIHTIALLAGVLKLRHRNDASTEAVTLLDSVVQSLSHQLDDLLDISKLDAGVVKVAAQPLSLPRFLHRRLDEVSNEARAKGLALQLRADQELSVFTDPNLLERVLRNLLDNAVKFTAQGGVTLTLQQEGEQALIKVSDTGNGIPPEQQREVFQEFVQLHNPERDRSMGMGLGLSIVDRLCRLLEIDLQLHSQPGQGATFALRLPLLVRSSSAVQQAPTQPLPPTLDLDVLVVDDEIMVRQATAWLLSEIGCRCQVAEDRASALDAVRTRRPDVALVDYRLRGGDDGIAVVQALREQIPGLPAAIVSGDIGPEQLQAVESAGLRLLHKPLSPRLLQTELHLAMGQRADTHEST